MTNNYQPPIDEYLFLINQVMKSEELQQLESYKELSEDLIKAVLEEAGKFASQQLAPINKSGDSQGSSLGAAGVTTPKGFKEAYAAFIESGWNAIACDKNFGGQDLPKIIASSVSEMWSAANMAFALCPLLTQGSIELLTHHGSDEQKGKYLENLISGKWTGTMCLTEPSAGSDVGALVTKSVKNGDHYLIKGQKIFITYGDHDFTENIIHMVLARCEGAPAGSKGISLFIVPKILEDGSANDLKAISLEHKLGIHASPTAVMSFGDNDGAVGYIVGEENQGLKYMFTMMNSARLAVGIEGLAMAENSYQQAVAYANERVQGKKLGGSEDVTIINHPDVQRMLLDIKSNIDAMRTLILYVSKSADLAAKHKDEATRQRNQDIVDLLIPVAKVHATDLGFELSSAAMQVFGGVGYIEETEIAQNLRDSRIAMIYEGTNGIQAMDLVFRKLTVNSGRAFDGYVRDAENIVNSCLVDELFPQHYIDNVKIAFGVLKEITATLQKQITHNPEKAAFIATPYLSMFGYVVGGVHLLQCAQAAIKSLDSGDGNEDFYKNKLKQIRHYVDFVMPDYISLETKVKNSLN